MFKTFFYLVLILSTLQSNDKAHTFEQNEVCKTCHPLIYDEFTASVHHNAATFKDPIHNAVWARHPQNLKENRYACGKCHSPAADDLDAMITKGQSAMPDAKNPTHREGIACAYCHRIQAIKPHVRSNTNIINETPRNYYGTRQSNGSPFHTIDTESNSHILNGNVCIGCHSHKMNSHGINVCSTNSRNEMDATNCVSCHMPKVKGSISTLTTTKKHAYHGFPGTHKDAELLADYIGLEMTPRAEGFSITIINRASHALLLHPMRMAVLKTTVVRDGQPIPLKDEVFIRIIGRDGKPAMPWAADTTLKDTMIQHLETRKVAYDFTLKTGDRVEAVLGYYLVNPKAVESLGLEQYEPATKFYILKERHFTK